MYVCVCVCVCLCVCMCVCLHAPDQHQIGSHDNTCCTCGMFQTSQTTRVTPVKDFLIGNSEAWLCSKVPINHEKATLSTLIALELYLERTNTWAKITYLCPIVCLTFFPKFLPNIFFSSQYFAGPSEKVQLLQFWPDPKVKMKFNFYKKQVINKRLVRVILLSYNR